MAAEDRQIEQGQAGHQIHLLAPPPRQQRGLHIAVALEVPVETAPGDLQALGDLEHAEVVEAALHHGGVRRVEPVVTAPQRAIGALALALRSRFGRGHRRGLGKMGAAGCRSANPDRQASTAALDSPVSLRPLDRSPRLAGGPMWPGDMAVH